MKTIGECLRNNWNSIDSATPEEQSIRINFHNAYGANKLKRKDFIFYEKYMWNKKVEKKSKKKLNRRKK